jgi:hypothetical protein
MLHGEPPKTQPYTGDDGVVLREGEQQRRVTAATVGGHDSSVCTDPTKGATWVAGLDGPLWMT